MIDVDVVSENNYWNKRIKKKFFFFNSLVNSFPKKYRYTKKKVKEISAHLTNEGIIVRQLDSYGLPNCLRITIGTQDEMIATIESLKKITKNDKKI